MGNTVEWSALASWVPPTLGLPPPPDHLTLLSPLGSSGSRHAWAATSELHPGCLTVVLFQPQPPGETIEGGSGGGRYIIDLDPQLGWLPCAVVTALPASLPEPFSGFELLSFVGLGPSGSVWMAESSSLPDTPLAIKFLDGYPDLYRRDVRERFLEQALASKRINSSSLVPTLDLLDLHEHGPQGWAPVALVSWLQEPSLQRVLDDLKAEGQTLADEMASELVRGLAQGLRDLHGVYELVHRDVKPANVLLRLPRERPYRGLESLSGARAVLADFTTSCRIAQRPLLSGLKPSLSPLGTETADSLRSPATEDEDWQGFLDVVAAVAEVAEERFREKIEASLPAGRGVKEIAEVLCARLFPEYLGETIDPSPDAAPPEERGLWRPQPASAPQQTDWTTVGEPSMPSLPPFEVPGYQMVQMLGRGGMGVVYQAVHLHLRRKVALKVLPPAYHVQHAMDRLQIEAEAIARLDHPNIVRIYDVGVLRDGLPYLAMEYLPGDSLRDWLGRPPSLRESAEVVRKLADAVAFAHSKGVIHRDLKPANVLLDADGSPKIIDFGLAKLIDEREALTGSGQVMGTPGYMAPEQARGDTSAIDRRADIYGLGGILYWLLTEKAPFEGHLRDGVLQRVIYEEPVPPRTLRPDIPRDLEAICLKCLRKEPYYRYTTAAELADDLQRWLEGRPILARPTGRLERLRRWCRRYPASAALTAGVALLLLMLGYTSAALYSYRQRSEALRMEHQVESSVAAAESALDHGQFAQALSLFDEARQMAPAGQRPAIEVKRLRCLFAYGHAEELQSELDRLGGRDDLPGKLRALVLLHRGDVSLCDRAADRQEAARDLIRRALVIPDGLGAADAAYARGLLDESTFDAVRHFKEALAHAPFHLRANAALLLELVLSGQFDQARQRAELMTEIFPDEPVTPLALALMATLQEDSAARARHLAELRRTVADPVRMAALDAVFAALDEAIAASRHLHGPNSEAARFAQPGHGILAGAFIPTLAVKQLRQVMNPFERLGSADLFGLGLPMVSRPARMVEELGKAYEKLAAGDATGAAALLAAAEKKYPESILRLLDAIAHLDLEAIHFHKGNLDGCFCAARRAHALTEEAADAPTLIPFAPYRPNASWLCLFIEVSWTAQYRSDATRLAGAVLASGSLNRFGAAATLAAGQQRLRTYPLPKDRRRLLRVVAEGDAFDAVRSEMLPRLLPFFEDDDARLLLKGWAGAAPKDPQPFRLLASFELERKNFGAALRWAELGLTEHPSDAELRQIQDRAKQALESAADEGK